MMISALSSSVAVGTGCIVEITTLSFSFQMFDPPSLRNPYQFLPITKYCHLNYEPMASDLISRMSMDATQSILP